VAKELTYTGRIFTGTEARELVSSPGSPTSRLLQPGKLAGEIASKSPDAIRGAKRLYDQSWTGSTHETLALEAKLQLALIGSPNQAGGSQRRVAKQPAEFVDLVAILCASLRGRLMARRQPPGAGYQGRVLAPQPRLQLSLS